MSLLTRPPAPLEFAVVRVDTKGKPHREEILRTRSRTYAMEVTAARNQLTRAPHVSYCWVRVREGK